MKALMIVAMLAIAAGTMAFEGCDIDLDFGKDLPHSGDTVE